MGLPADPDRRSACTSAPCAASVRPATGPAITRDRSSTRTPASGRSPAGHGFGAGLADLLDRDHAAVRPAPWRAARPTIRSMRAHHRHHAAAGIGRGLERLGVPLHQCGLNRRRAPACSSAPCRRRRGDAGNWCAAARSGGRGSCKCRRSHPRSAPAACRRRADNARCGIRPRVSHVDRDLLRLPAARLPDLRGGKSGRGNAGLRRGGDAKRRRQLRLVAGQRDVVERGWIAAGGGPDIGQNFLGLCMIPRCCPKSFVRPRFPGANRARFARKRDNVQSSALAWKELQWLPSIH